MFTVRVINGTVEGKNKNASKYVCIFIQRAKMSVNADGLAVEFRGFERLRALGATRGWPSSGQSLSALHGARFICCSADKTNTERS